ncbi:hypothetical protein BD324DRAFT_636665 [Kockovaella imperatae]|uniref:Uncharacterized protein n=1 Tax=Kockovaella imperatae TaxID=4999 RepID=A0A1Y1U7X8_9TREE|nr:hypothetical protein BD324DRAFT_636665 [Kockovaella imperatae]ORX34113.1 hypothetical protein BD324DRAFT_636665 [Kockovaella imperatae]
MALQPNPLKILAIGSPLSQLDETASKIRAINSKHGPFDACVLVGDVFAEESDGMEVEGLSFPLPTYFTLGKFPLPERIQEKISLTGGEVVDNLVFLGKASVLTTAQGLKIGCVGGVYQEELYNAPNSNADPYTPVMAKPAIDALLSSSALNPTLNDASSSLASARQSSSALPTAFQGLDLLILSAPPPHLSLLSTTVASLGHPLATAAEPLAEVVKKARPRYMLWADGEGFWEREPFGWKSSSGREERWTRSVKLGAFGALTPEGGKKTRWFYAFSLPAQTPTTSIPERPKNATPNPYSMSTGSEGSAGVKRGADDEEDGEVKRSRTGKLC